MASVFVDFPTFHDEVDIEQLLHILEPDELKQDIDAWEDWVKAIKK